MQEVFTTLLDNSIRYAFPTKNSPWIFKISINKIGKMLQFEISDNGIGRELEKYRTSKPEDGLNVFNDRIINAFELAGKKRKEISDIQIFPSKERGTTIKFNYPYGEVENIHS